MDATTVLSVALPAVFVVVGIALVVLLIELYRTVKFLRATVDDVKNQIEPTLEHVEYITRTLQPAIDKVDPLVDRVSLTLDAANLELMRVDQILEDVTTISDTASNAVVAVDSVTNAPINAVKSVSDKVRSVLQPKTVSDETARLGRQRAAAAQALEQLKSEEQKSGLRASVPCDDPAVESAVGRSEADAGAAAPSPSSPSSSDGYFHYGSSSPEKTA